ncbi:MAG TPA: biotin-dependent carboxyltransferase family protein [Actinomycetota bacterium]|nr:biotin-dependent carboxyltransferase family protein [Actinomycetota bacterium]
MIRIVGPAIATSVQDQGRFGSRILGIGRSGAMDPESLRAANRAAGAYAGSAGIEFGPGVLVVETTAAGTLAFGGAPRTGAPWWETLEVDAGRRFQLGSPAEGMWSYLAIGGGVNAPLVMGSRSTSVREGIGAWLAPGEVLYPGAEAAAPEPPAPPQMTGEIRVFGNVSGEWTVGARVDRMGYQLEGGTIPGGRSDLHSEPLLPGCIQIPPNGKPIVLMAEGPTVGGYTLGGVIHSEDLRLVAQTQPGGRLTLMTAITG